MQIGQNFIRAARDWIRRRIFEDHFFDYGEGSVQCLGQRVDFFLQWARVQQHLKSEISSAKNVWTDQAKIV